MELTWKVATKTLLLIIGYGYLINVLSSCNDSSDTWSMSYDPDTGEFTLTNDCNSTLFTRIRMSEIVEYDSVGLKTINQVTSFSGPEFEWVTLDGYSTEYQGLSVMKNTYVAILDIGDVYFNLTTLLFLENGTISIDDDSTYDIQKYSLKYDITILDWPFESLDNTLAVCMHAGRGSGSSSSGTTTDTTDTTDTLPVATLPITTEEPNVPTTPKDTSDPLPTLPNRRIRRRRLSKSKIKSVDFGENNNHYTFDFPLSSKLDDIWYGESSVDLDYTSHKRNLTFCLEFKSFNESLYYDPIVYNSFKKSKSKKNKDSSDVGIDIGGEWGFIGLGIACGTVCIGLLCACAIKMLGLGGKEESVDYGQMHDRL